MSTNVCLEVAFVCQCCGSVMSDEHCFGVVQIDCDYRNAELWCFQCVDKYAFCDLDGIWRKKFVFGK